MKRKLGVGVRMRTIGFKWDTDERTKETIMMMRRRRGKMMATMGAMVMVMMMMRGMMMIFKEAEGELGGPASCSQPVTFYIGRAQKFYAMNIF